MKKIKYSAPAKVIISGEYAAVFGKPAVVCAINLRLAFELWEAKKKNKDEVIDFIDKKTKEFLRKNNIKYTDKNYDFRIQSEIPIGRRLGSSAALSSSAAAAFLEFYTGKKNSIKTVNQLASEVEKYFHKNSSGVDPAVSCYGGLLYYRKEFEFLRSINRFNTQIPKSIEKNLFMIDSGKSEENTKEMVAMVEKLYKDKTKFIEEIFNGIEKTTKQLALSLVKKDEVSFAKSLVDNEIFLEMLGVVSQRTKKLLERLMPYGVGKVTGAGGAKDGSGYLLFYSNKSDQLIKFLKQNKINFFKFRQNSQGLI